MKEVYRSRTKSGVTPGGRKYSAFKSSSEAGKYSRVTVGDRVVHTKLKTESAATGKKTNVKSKKGALKHTAQIIDKSFKRPAKRK